MTQSLPFGSIETEKRIYGITQLGDARVIYKAGDETTPYRVLGSYNPETDALVVKEGDTTDIRFRGRCLHTSAHLEELTGLLSPFINAGVRVVAHEVRRDGTVIEDRDPHFLITGPVKHVSIVVR
jgi:hypothetical protein